jgi:hypothetical protein
MICPVVVRNNSYEGRLHMLSPLVFTSGFSPRAVVSGFFYCHGIPQGGIANGLYGLNPRNTAHGTPPCKRRPALVWRLVKQLVHGGNKASCISEQTRHANLGFIVNNIKLGAGRIPLYPPLVELCQEKSKGVKNGE